MSHHLTPPQQADRQSKVYCEARPRVRRILLIDDVVRTGGTIAKVTEYLRGQFPHATIDSMALVLVADKRNTDPFTKIDYAAWISSDPAIQLPWSQNEHPDPKGYFENDDVEQIVDRLLEHSSRTGTG